MTKNQCSFSQKHCVKSVRIRSYSGPYFPAFAINTERYFVSLRINSECGKIWTRMTPNTDTFYAVTHPSILLIKEKTKCKANSFDFVLATVNDIEKEIKKQILTKQPHSILYRLKC